MVGTKKEYDVVSKPFVRGASEVDKIRGKIVLPSTLKVDSVNSPSHYNSGDIECIQAIEASMSKEELQGYLKGNTIKYLWRYKYKENPAQDLDKALWYLNRLRGTL